MKQLPAAYTTAAFGPVFAYQTRDDLHACCVTHRDEYVVVHHDDLMPLPTNGSGPPGADVIAELAEYAGEVMAPHMLNSRDAKPLRPRRSTVGEAALGCRLFWAAVHAPGELVEQGWGKPPRVAGAPRPPPRRDCGRCFAVTGYFCTDCPATIDNRKETA
jgi:hypothetical protein